MEFALLAVAGFLAGLIDAVAGGGGLVQIPALFSAYPNIAPATLIGTNKGGVSAGVMGSVAPVASTASAPAASAPAAASGAASAPAVPK